MKILMIVFLIGSSMSALANSSLEQKIKSLEARIESLERKLNSQSSTSSNGLKVRDMNNSEVSTGGVRGIASGSGTSSAPSISPEKQKEIMEQMELFKKRQKESQKMLDELMNEP